MCIRDSHELSQRAEGDASSLDEQLAKVTKAHQATVASLQSELEAARRAGAAPLQQELSRLQAALDAAETSKAKALAEASETLEQCKRDAATRETELREAAHQDIMRERDLAEKATASAPDAAAIRAALVEEFKGRRRRPTDRVDGVSRVDGVAVRACRVAPDATDAASRVSAQASSSRRKRN